MPLLLLTLATLEKLLLAIQTLPVASSAIPPRNVLLADVWPIAVWNAPNTNEISLGSKTPSLLVSVRRTMPFTELSSSSQRRVGAPKRVVYLRSWQLRRSVVEYAHFVYSPGSLAIPLPFK